MTAAIIIISIAILAAILIVYHKVAKPLRTIASGIDLLRAQDFSSRLAHVGQKEADRIVDMFNGMMDSLKQERLRLREQNHFLDLLIEVSPTGIIILEPGAASVIAGANRAASQMLGVKDPGALKGKPLSGLPSPLAPTLSALSDRERRTVRLSNAMVVRCSRLSFMERGVPHSFLMVETLTEEVLKAERKAYEKVIRMMAHEVNNSLGGMISIAETASECTSDPDLREALLASSRRGRDMGEFITKFASAVKVPEPQRVDADFRELLERWLPMLESVCSAAGAHLQADLPEEALRVFADPVLMEQCLTNIVKNAAESAGPGGTVRIYREAAEIVVEDDGPGITPEAADMLFTPFFTTKPDGHGLGLLMVTEILRQHSFPFSLRTEPDGLTRFRLRILTD